MDMLDEPQLSRQWVVRRMQRALTIDRTAAALLRGLAHGGGARRPALARAAEEAAGRAERLLELIRAIGSVPYPSWGVASTAARWAGRFAARLPWSWQRYALRRLAAFTLAEYDALRAFVRTAVGIPDSVRPAAPELFDSASQEYALLTGAAEPEARC